MIIDRAGYRADLNELYNRKTSATTLDRAKPVDIVNDLENIMENKETRRLNEQVYSVSQKEPKTKQPGLKSALKMPEVRTQDYRTEPKRAPTAKFQYPCKACLKTPGTEAAQKKLCTASSHCKFHGGRYKCMLDERCKERVAKEEAMLKYQTESMPPGMTVRQIKEATIFFRRGAR